MTPKQTKKISSKVVKSTIKVSLKGKTVDAELMNLSFSEIEAYAEKEYNESKSFLGTLKYTEEEYASAIKRLKLAAMLGYTPAQFQLAVEYLSPIRKDTSLY